jgi:hypothetical protein
MFLESRSGLAELFCFFFSFVIDLVAVDGEDTYTMKYLSLLILSLSLVKDAQSTSSRYPSISRRVLEGNNVKNSGRTKGAPRGLSTNIFAAPPGRPDVQARKRGMKRSKGKRDEHDSEDEGYYDNYKDAGYYTSDSSVEDFHAPGDSFKDVHNIQEGSLDEGHVPDWEKPPTDPNKPPTTPTSIKTMPPTDSPTKESTNAPLVPPTEPPAEPATPEPIEPEPETSLPINSPTITEIPSATTTSPIQVTCLSDSSGDFGPKEGDETEVEYLYQLEVFPGVTVQAATAQLEKKLVDFLLPDLFPQLCTTLRRLQASSTGEYVGISAAPPDVLATGCKCTFLRR